MNSQAELLKHLGVTTDQVQSTKRPPPEWFDKAIQEAQFHILSVLSNDRTSAIHWAISGEKIQEVFDKYKVTGTTPGEGQDSRLNGPSQPPHPTTHPAKNSLGRKPKNMYTGS